MKFTIIILAIVMSSMLSGKSSKETVLEEMQIESRGKSKGQRGGKGNFEDMITQMDGDNDSKLSKAEVKWPIVEDFDKIDTDSDGYITLKDL